MSAVAYQLQFDETWCPKCKSVACADYVDNGVGMQQCGPYRCQACGWIEEQPDERLLIDNFPEEEVF